jgi:hypothetical protein
MTQQQEEETPGGTTNDAVGTRKDTVETTKNTVGTTKEPVETTKNTVGTTKGTVGTKNASGGRVSLTLSTNGSTAKDPKTDTPDERNGATRTTTPADTDSENAA